MTMYEKVGGVSVIKSLADEFYTVMENDTKAQSLRKIHSPQLIHARKNLFRFLSEWLGGPKLFGARHVTAEWLELRHRHFGLAQEHVDQWLYCMNKAMDNLAIEAQIKQDLDTRFNEMIQSMRARREMIES